VHHCTIPTRYNPCTCSLVESNTDKIVPVPLTGGPRFSHAVAHRVGPLNLVNLVCLRVHVSSIAVNAWSSGTVVAAVIALATVADSRAFGAAGSESRTLVVGKISATPVPKGPKNGVAVAVVIPLGIIGARFSAAAQMWT